MKKNNSLHIFRWLPVFLASLFIICLAVIFRDKLEQFKALGILGIFVANFLASATLFFPAPGIATVIAGGTLYPPILVAIAATLGASLGDMLGYVVGNSGKRLVLSHHGKTYERLIQLFKKYGGVIIFIFALVPNPLFDAIGIIAGALHYPVRKFFLWLFLGRLARNLLLAYSGQALGAF